jgi:hypothetical protein
MAHAPLRLLLDRLLEERVLAKLEGGELVVRQVDDRPIPEPVRREIRRRRNELLEWLTWEGSADALWRALFRRHAQRADLASDERFQELLREADEAHTAHDRERLVRWLLAMEEHANQTDGLSPEGSPGFEELDRLMREPSERTL